jgi:hypothetical protein
MYGIQVKSGDDSKTPNGVRRIVNGVGQTTIINDKTGETSSEWCYGEDLPDASPRALSYVGYCTTFYDDGSLLWTSITWNAGDNQSGRWIVLGGSGRYAGATGGGTSANVSTRADGNAWTGRGSGTITTP